MERWQTSFTSVSGTPRSALNLLPAALTGVLRQFAPHRRRRQVIEPFRSRPSRQHLLHQLDRNLPPTSASTSTRRPRRRHARYRRLHHRNREVLETTEQLHDDTAPRVRNALGTVDLPTRPSTPPKRTFGLIASGSSNPPKSASSASATTSATAPSGTERPDPRRLQPRHPMGPRRRRPRYRRTKKIQQNVEKLLAFTLSVEKHCRHLQPSPLDRIRRTVGREAHRQTTAAQVELEPGPPARVHPPHAFPGWYFLAQSISGSGALRIP